MAVIAKILASLLRTAQVLGALFIAGTTSYFVVRLANRDLMSGNGRAIAVEVISCAGLIWALFAFLFSICLLQKSFFQFFTVLGDLLFVGGFMAIAILLRHAWDGECRNNRIYVPWLQRGGNSLNANCRLVKGIFIVAIVLCVLFFLTLLTSFLAHRSSKKDRAYGPSPANNYTSGRGKRHHKTRDIEAAPVAGATLAPVVADTRPSHDSKYTDATEKTNDPALISGTTGAGREYLAPRGFAGNEGGVSPVPSNHNLRGNKEHSHAGQYAMAGALAGGAAAHHHNKKNTDGLPLHPGPEDHTTERIPQDPDHLNTMNTYTTGTANSAYSELDTTTGPPSTYHTPGVYPGSKGGVQPTAFYPAANGENPHYYSSEMEAAGNANASNPGYQAYGIKGAEGERDLVHGEKKYEEYQSPLTSDAEREEVGFGYGNGPGIQGGGGNQIQTLPELGREDGKRF